MRFSFAVIFWLIIGGAALAGDFDFGAFSRLPVQHEGRIKPLETFALVHLEKFYGRSHIGDLSASAWLAEAMFDPASAMDRPLFLVKDADTQAMLSLPARADNLYRFSEAMPAMGSHRALVESLLKLPAAELSAAQRGVLELYENTGLFAQITLSCTLFLPLAVHIPGEEGPSFLDYYPHLAKFQQSLQAVVARKGSNLDAYTPAEAQLADGVEKLSMTLATAQDNNLLRIFPPQWGGRDAWLSPWEIFHLAQGSPQTAALMAQWRALASAYQEHDAARWGEASRALKEKIQAAPSVRPQALALEALYYDYSPLIKSIILYLAALMLILAAMLGIKRAFLRAAAWCALSLGVVCHMAALAARIFILERPPVGTLYESLLFVSLIAVLSGLLLEWRMRNHLGIVISALSGSLLLLTSESFAGEDTMGMLIAVLNTNFWLATHVLCITMGYGFGLVAGIIAHAYLLLRCLNRDAGQARGILRAGYGTALVALLFTSLGTILGGIWADQSWGRFWGWDPKENGALLICLWLIWLLHGRVSGRLHERGFAVALALLTVVIALSWLGVNLLATGLHSYGFTDKAALALGLFCGAEGLFAAAAYVLLWRRDRAAPL